MRRISAQVAFRYELERNFAIKAGVQGPVNLAHATRTDLIDKLVGPKARASNSLRNSQNVQTRSEVQ